MNITNLALIFVVVVVAIAAIVHMIRKNKNELVDGMEIDDKTYTLEKMIKFVKQRLDEITKINLYDIGLSEEELILEESSDLGSTCIQDSFESAFVDKPQPIENSGATKLLFKKKKNSDNQ